MRIHFTPCKLAPTSKPYYGMLAGLFEISDLDSADIIWNWNFKSPHQGVVKSGRPVINGQCWNIAKDYIDKAFAQVYGYSTAAKRRYAIEKPIGTNGFKDCKFVDLSKYIKRIECFYQMPLFSLKKAGEFEIHEVRYVIMDGLPVLTIGKHKVMSRENIPGRVIGFDFFTTETPKAYTKLIQFCSLLHIDYAEIDVLTYNGKIFIIDVNTTPGDTIFRNPDQEKAGQLKRIYVELLGNYLQNKFQTS